MKRAKETPNPVSEKAREEEQKFLQRWKGAKKREHRNVWQKRTD